MSLSAIMNSTTLYIAVIVGLLLIFLTGVAAAVLFAVLDGNVMDNGSNLQCILRGCIQFFQHPDCMGKGIHL